MNKLLKDCIKGIENSLLEIDNKWAAQQLSTDEYHARAEIITEEGKERLYSTRFSFYDGDWGKFPRRLTEPQAIKPPSLADPLRSCLESVDQLGQAEAKSQQVVSETPQQEGNSTEVVPKLILPANTQSDELLIASGSMGPTHTPVQTLSQENWTSLNRECSEAHYEMCDQEKHQWTTMQMDFKYDKPVLQEEQEEEIVPVVDTSLNQTEALPGTGVFN